MSFVGKDNFLKVLSAAEQVYATKLYKLKGAPEEVQEPLKDNLDRIQAVMSEFLTLYDCLSMSKRLFPFRVVDQTLVSWFAVGRILGLQLYLLVRIF